MVSQEILEHYIALGTIKHVSTKNFRAKPFQTEMRDRQEETMQKFRFLIYT